MKNKKKKGFTLIELLAIIVILAIIAVITVPIILNIIENSRKGAATDSAYGYKDALNKYYLEKLSKDSNYNIPTGTYTVNTQTGYLVGTTTLEIQVSGKIPAGGAVQIEKNAVKQACLKFDEYAVPITNGEVGKAQKGSCNGTLIGSSSDEGSNTQSDSIDISAIIEDIEPSSDGAKYILDAIEVYYNPTTGEKCNPSDAVSTTGTTTGCLHWYLYSVKGNYANMLLDHNITAAGAENGAWALEADYTDAKAESAGIKYSSARGAWGSGSNERGPVTALNTLKSLTSNWVTPPPRVPNSTSTNEYIVPMSENDGKFQIDYSLYKARLITDDEIRNLGCRVNSCPEWMNKGTYKDNPSTYSNIDGYWTVSPFSNVSEYVSSVDCRYNRDDNKCSEASDGVSDTSRGVRPVITVAVEKIERASSNQQSAIAKLYDSERITEKTIENIAVGDTARIGTEEFIVINTNKNGNVVLLAENNLIEQTNGIAYNQPKNGIMLMANTDNDEVWKQSNGLSYTAINYSEDNYWYGTQNVCAPTIPGGEDVCEDITGYFHDYADDYEGKYIYRESDGTETENNIHPKLDIYKGYLQSFGINVSDIRLMSKTEANGLPNSPWLYESKFWLGSVSARSDTYIYTLYNLPNDGAYFDNGIESNIGIRPVIEISRDEF